MIIEDEELRELYKTSSSEHLQKLETDLMILEKNPQDTAAIEEFLREAHTLKGDSRMLGLDDIEMLVHHLEDCVEQIKAGHGAITPELCDRLYQGIDAIDRLSHQAITGEAAEVNTVEVLALLMGVGQDPKPATNSEADLFGDDDFFGSSSDGEADLFDDDADASPPSSLEADLFDDDQDTIATAPVVANVAASQSKIKTPEVSKDYKIDTIRVEPQKLDTLMTQASELAVTKLRISQQMTEINEILALWSGWDKYGSIDRQIFTEIEHKLTPEQFQPLKYFLDNSQQQIETLGNLANNLKARADEDIASLNIISDRLESGIQGLRQLPLSTVFNIYPRMVRDLARQQGKEIELVIEGGDTKADKRILEEIKDPLLHLIRNAIDHGIETPAERISQGKPQTATLILRGYQIGGSIGIEISDDGRGLNLDSIQHTAIRRKVRTEAELAAMSESEIQSLIFASGFSTRTEVTELSGRGVGLDVVRANVERLKGSIEVTSTPGNGCKFQVRLNTSLATTKVLIVDLDRTLYALPLEFIQTMITISSRDIYEIENNSTITFEDRPLSIAWLSKLLQLPTPDNYTQGRNNLACIILQVGSESFGVIVDDLVDQQDVVLKPQSKLLKRVPNITGATILGSGSVCMILNPADLLHSIRNGSWQNVARSVESATVKNKLLLVEDSIIIRTQMQRLLKGAGYDVTVAEDGLQGLLKVQTENFDIILSDVEMPNMSGLEMTANIRSYSQYDRLPIVLITTLASPEDKRRGEEAGANAYLTKGDFDQQLLFDTLKRLVNSQ
ncbi:hybrid sensor histidine kinase/response regulator [Pleurocapsales cyanobacterium LEGE 10410]|nr:hybrid sensor histidine kinase/response regulator [Pleurocapsales cyanobacterium LEGE 10410]